ncbi:Uncharacterized protein Fot_23729 [Forsythia ovata]|uniref:Uncharacterized protein n=1 Tax=Forsythia ovata TaxID=205694 RepID=A0ABD1U476_9LAMI
MKISNNHNNVAMRLISGDNPAFIGDNPSFFGDNELDSLSEMQTDDRTRGGMSRELNYVQDEKNIGDEIIDGNFVDCDGLNIIPFSPRREDLYEESPMTNMFVAIPSQSQLQTNVNLGHSMDDKDIDKSSKVFSDWELSLQHNAPTSWQTLRLSYCGQALPCCRRHFRQVSRN